VIALVLVSDFLATTRTRPFSWPSRKRPRTRRLTENKQARGLIGGDNTTFRTAASRSAVSDVHHDAGRVAKPEDAIGKRRGHTDEGGVLALEDRVEDHLPDHGGSGREALH
jgi:hypothetical protein